MKNYFSFLFLLFFVTACEANRGSQTEDLYDIPFDMPQINRPSIPNFSISISDYGGKGDGITDNSHAFDKALSAIRNNGGGTLNIPQGVWLTGPIELPSNTELHLDDHAIITFSEDKDAYPIVETLFEGRDTYRCQPQLSAVNQHDIAITGHGIINGMGDSWRVGQKGIMPPSVWNSYVSSGGILSDDGETWYPSQSYYLGAKDAIQNAVPWAKTMEDFQSVRDFLRPVMVHIRACEKVLLSGVSFQNSPCWNVHITMSSSVIIDSISVKTQYYAKNGDGIDIESCNGLIMTGSTFDVGDDDICIKSGKDAEGRKRNMPAQNIIIDNCTALHGHGGFVVGSEMSGGVKNILVRNCKFSGTDVGLRFKSKRGRGGVVENIYINNIYMDNIQNEALLFDMFYQSKAAASDSTIIADETTPQFRKISISNVSARKVGKAMLFNGLPEMKLDDIKVNNCSFSAESGIKVNETKNILLKDISLELKKGPAIMQNNAELITVKDLTSNFFPE